MERIETKKVIGFFMLLLIPSITILSSLYLLLKGEDVKGVSIYKKTQVHAPYITNLMPKIATVGEEYIFVPKIVAEERGSVRVNIVEGPSWLIVDSEYIVRGYPRREDVGTYLILIEVEDDYGRSTIKEYIIVLENEE